MAVEYPSCTKCGEYARAALRKNTQEPICLCCADTRHRLGRCSVCQKIRPLEKHHIGGNKHTPKDTIPACLNCHAILTDWQCRFWHRSWRESEPRPSLFYLQGILDATILQTKRGPKGESQTDILFLALIVGVLFLCSYLGIVLTLPAEWAHLTFPENLP